jgi:hypothetical protein
MLYDSKTHTTHFAPLVDGQYMPYQIKNIVDRLEVAIPLALD